MADDDWGEPAVAQSGNPTSFDDEGGRSYGKGRGFIVQNNNNDEWGAGNTNFNSGGNNGGGFTDYNSTDNDGQWNSNGNDYGNARGGRGGGRGGRNNRGRGGGGGRGGYRNRQENNDDYGYGNQDDDGDNDAGNGGFKSSGRSNYRDRNNDFDDNNYGQNDFESGEDGGRRGGRGGGRGGRGGPRDSGDREEGERPKTEIYIPPELSTDEQSLFERDFEMGINFAKYDDIEVKINGDNPPQPIETFNDAGLRNIVLENIKKSGYTKPTPVQKYALPIIMGGRDLMACAQTGSGKTAAFAIPIINTLLDQPTDLIVSSNHCEPQVIIVSPTRELTIQIWKQISKYSLHSILKTVVAYGGTSVMHQREKLSSGCHILVATPGRLLDFLDRGRIKFSSVRFLVLDEADRMLDMGFLPCIERIVDHETMVPIGERQTLMFSATFPDEVQRLASRFLNAYLFLAVGIVGGACADVEQNFYEVAKNRKTDMLKEIMERESDAGTLKGTMVFVEMKRKADFIAAFLSENNYPTTSIHGDRLQRQREEALEDFKRGKMAILVATAVAARGLDIKNVSHVINFDLPKGIDEYVHRIGRTGRVGNRGRATSFFDPVADEPLRSDLVRILRQANQPIPDCLSAGGVTKSYAPGRGSRFGAEDIRGYEDGGASYPEGEYNPPVAAEPDEEW